MIEYTKIPHIFEKLLSPYAIIVLYHVYACQNHIVFALFPQVSFVLVEPNACLSWGQCAHLCIWGCADFSLKQELHYRCWM